MYSVTIPKLSDSHAASESLRERLVHLTQSAPPPNDPHALSFEHRVLEAVLHEDTLYKRDRYLRLSQLISSATTPEATSKYSLSIDGYQQYHQIREASLYRLLTLSRSLKALSLDVKRSSAALAQLLASDEDMAGTYLTFQASGAVRSVDQHTDVEIMLEDFATEH